MNDENFIGIGGKLFSMNGKLPAPGNKKTIDWSDPKGKEVSMTWPKMKRRREGDREKKRW
jgi:hypothetical protein